MTLLVALRGRDGLVLAADSRGTFGDPRGVTAQNDAQHKAHILSGQVAALVAGSGEIGSLIIKEVKARIQADGIEYVSPVLDICRNTVRESYYNWFPNVPAIQPPALATTGQVPVRPDLALLIVGYEGDGTPRIFQIGSATDFSPMLHDYGFAVSGVVQYALYLLNRLYQPNRSVQELMALAVYSITETASQDGKVGGPVNVITITPEEGCNELDQHAVTEIQAQNEERSRALRESFYEGE